MSQTETIAGSKSGPQERESEAVERGWRAPWSTLGLGLAAGVGASLCCIPILFLLVGVGGAWMGTLTALEPYRPYFLGLTLVCLGLAFHRLYLVPRACAGGEACVTPRTLRRQRTLFWAITTVVGLLIGIPWYAPYLMG